MAENESLSIVLLCDTPNVSRAAYYKWLNHQLKSQEMGNQQLMDAIRHFYTQVDVIYGYRRITISANLQRRTVEEREIERFKCFWGALKVEEALFTEVRVL